MILPDQSCSPSLSLPACSLLLCLLSCFLSHNFIRCFNLVTSHLHGKVISHIFIQSRSDRGGGVGEGFFSVMPVACVALVFVSQHTDCYQKEKMVLRHYTFKLIGQFNSKHTASQRDITRMRAPAGFAELTCNRMQNSFSLKVLSPLFSFINQRTKTAPTTFSRQIQ